MPGSQWATSVAGKRIQNRGSASTIGPPEKQNTRMGGIEMRLARIALILSVILLGTPALRAQRAHSECCDGCSSQSCQQGCGCQACGDSCGLMSSLTAKLSHALGGILPGGAGCDGRHKIYKAALQRNSFDKKFQLPVAYYAHLLPIYKHNRCCCGSTPMANCPHLWASRTNGRGSD